MDTQDIEVKARAIIHLDMDAFYPAVEVLDNPELKKKPVIVGGIHGRGVVSSCSYEARKFGIHSAQPMATAMRLCPNGTFLPVRMSRYQEISGRIFKIYHLFTPLVEPVSIDEAFLDVSRCTRLFGQPEDIAKEIKRIVLKEIGLTVSAGMAPSKFVAKIASDINKPDGLTMVKPGKVREFLDPLPVDKMWGVGKVSKKSMARLGVRTIKDLSRVPVKVLAREFGKNGAALHQLSRGMDEREVSPEKDVKSVGHEKTFLQDISTGDEAEKELLSLAMDVAWRMRRNGFVGRAITLKVKYNDFVQITRSRTLPEMTDDAFEIYPVCCQLLKKTEVGERPIRLLGISLSQLSLFGAQKQLSLFEQGRGAQKRNELNSALDSIYRKFGEHSIRPGRLLAKT
ncbi:MAG: DNA polymerase IV [Desulfobacterales bacterium]|nr:DNA polymerase IV [Desulfobacterales bacterium]